MDDDDTNQPSALSPRVILYDIVQQSSNAPEQSQEASVDTEHVRGSRRRHSESREVSPLSEEDFVMENLKKRKKRGAMKLPSPTQTQKPVEEKKDEQDDDGVLCPICYEEWDMSGLHRLTSLKCGHLFGHSCIKRWLNECPSNARVCPSCKTKAAMRDMRFLYAKRLRMVDNSETERLKMLLEESVREKTRVHAEMSMLRHKYEQQLSENARLTREIAMLRNGNSYSEDLVPKRRERMVIRSMYKLFLEKNVELNRESGCRVIEFGRKTRSLVVSQKSNQELFPGFGVRFVDVGTLKPTTFMHMTSRSIRDVAFDREGEWLAAASADQVVKVFDVTSKLCAATLKCPEDDASLSKVIWSCCFDSSRDQSVIVGCQNGRVSRFDMRNPSSPQDFRAQPIDRCPVINIVSIPPDFTLPFGGVLVCTLQNLWLYELAADGMPSDITSLPLDGPFTAMVYDDVTKYILVTLKPSQAINRLTAQYMVGKLDRQDDVIFFKVTNSFSGSSSMPAMFRSALVNLEGDTLVAAYVHSSKMLTTWSTRDQVKLQTIAVSDSILDLCPFSIEAQNYLGALTDTKCRFYKIE